MDQTRIILEEKEKIFLSVLESHKGIIYKVARTYCFDRDDQDDLIQEITLQVWQSIGNFNGQFKWSTWIYRVALNTSISFYRKNKTRKERTERLGPVIELPAAQEAHPEDGDVALLHRLIRELKEIDRALILLSLDGLSSKEMAEVMDTTQTNVTSRLSRIRKKLKTNFEEHKRKHHGKH